MATFKAEVYAHQKRADGTYNIKIRVIHKTKKKYISSPFYVFKEDLTRSLKLKNQYYIDECNKIIKKYISICSQLGEGINYMDVDQVVEYIKKNNFNSYTGFDLDVVKYTRDYIAQLKQDGNKGNASTYEVMINNFIKFVGRDKISVHEILVKFIHYWINCNKH